jgi:hypothetical protein
VRLGELDARHLPRAAAWLRARVDRYAVLRERVTRAAQAWEPQALDTRYGGRAPFSLLRSNPALALTVTGAVLAAGLGTALVQEGRTPDDTIPGMSASELFPQGDSPQGMVLGPRIGVRVDDYVKTSTNGLVDAVHVAPGSTRVALVSMREYRTPEQARIVLSGFDVRRVFLRAPAAGKQASALPVDVHGPLLAAIQKAYRDTARLRLQAQHSFQGYAEALRPKSSQDREFRDLYFAYARSSGIEAREFARECACVFAALVLATPAQLLTLNARSGIRVVQVAAPGVTVLQVQAQPLLPEVTGVVPRPSARGYG